jgi:DNA end-binding protein Ku
MADPRASSSATITCGRLQVPVRLFPALESTPKNQATAMLHKGCGAVVRQVLRCSKDQVLVERKDTERGFEVAKNRFAALPDDGEQDDVDEEAVPTIDLREFLPRTLDSLVYFDESRNYLGPDNGAECAYQLLLLALRQADRVGIGKRKIQSRERLVMIVPVGDHLVLQQLHYPDHVRALAAVPVSKPETSPPALAEARRLIKKQGRVTFDLAAYIDEDRARLAAKIAKVIDEHQALAGEELLAELKASVPRAPRRQRRAS